MPGCTAYFRTLWDHPAALLLALELGWVQRMLGAGVRGMAAWRGKLQIRFRQRTLEHVEHWAKSAAAPDVAADHHRRIAGALWQVCGRDGADLQLRQQRLITGRAGLYPAHYQSDQVDRAGRLARRALKPLRFDSLLVGDNLVECHYHFQRLAEGKGPAVWTCANGTCAWRGASAASAIRWVAGGQVFCHPAVHSRDYILRKLALFYAQHDTPAQAMLDDLRAAAGHLPAAVPAAEERQSLP